MNSRKSVSVVFELKDMSLIVLHSVFQEKSRLVLIEKPNMKALTNPSDTNTVCPIFTPKQLLRTILRNKIYFQKHHGFAIQRTKGFTFKPTS